MLATIERTEEGNSWDDVHAGAKGTHATLWRAIFNAQRKRSQTPPNFVWVPSHLRVEEAVQQGICPIDWAGNQWADFFAKEGARQVRLPGGRLIELQRQTDEAVSRAKYLAWASCERGG